MSHKGEPGRADWCKLLRTHTSVWQRRGRKRVLSDFLGSEGKHIQETLPLKLTPGCFISSCLVLLLSIRAEKPILVSPIVRTNLGGLCLGQRVSRGTDAQVI